MHRPKMRWATTIFRVVAMTPELKTALVTAREHILEAHPDIKEIRCYVSGGDTEIMWQEGFEDYHAFQRKIDAHDDRCEEVMGDVFRHVVPGTKIGRILNDAI